MAAKYNVSVVRGDTFQKTPTFRRKATGAPVDLTGATITGTVGALTMSCAVTNGAAGQFRFGLSTSQTQSLVAGVYPMEVIVTYSDATVQTLIQGNYVSI